MRSKEQDIDDEDIEDIYDDDDDEKEEEPENQNEEIELQYEEEDIVPGASTSKPKPNNGKTIKKALPEIKGSARENLLEDMKFSVIKKFERECLQEKKD